MPPRERLSPRRTVGFLRRLAPRVRPYRVSLLLAGVLMLLSTAVGLAFPLIVRELLDAAFFVNDSGLLNQITLGLLGLFAVQGVVNFGQSYLTASVSERVVADLRRDVFASLVHQPPGFFASRRVGELTSRLSSDSGLVQGVLRFGVPELVRQWIFCRPCFAPTASWCWTRAPSWIRVRTGNCWTGATVTTVSTGGSPAVP